MQLYSHIIAAYIQTIREIQPKDGVTYRNLLRSASTTTAANPKSETGVTHHWPAAIPASAIPHDGRTNSVTAAIITCAAACSLTAAQTTVTGCGESSRQQAADHYAA